MDTDYGSPGPPAPPYVVSAGAKDPLCPLSGTPRPARSGGRFLVTSDLLGCICRLAVYTILTITASSSQCLTVVRVYVARTAYRSVCRRF